MVDQDFKIHTLRALDIFAPLSDDALELIRPAVSVRECSTGDVVMAEGSEGSELFVLLLGELKIVKNHRGPKETIVATLSPIEVFGEMALLSRAKRSASVVASEPCRFLTLTRDALEGVLLSQPEVCLALLRDAHSRITELLSQVGHTDP